MKNNYEPKSNYEPMSLPEVEELRGTVRQAVEKRIGGMKLSIDPQTAGKALEGLRKQGCI